MIRKIILNSVLVLILALMPIDVFASSSATELTPLETLRGIGAFIPNYPDFFATGQHPEAPPNYGQPGVGTFTSPLFFAIDLIKLILGSLAFLVIIIGAISLVINNNEEEYGKAKQTLVWGIVGLIIVQLASIIVNQLFFGESGEAFRNQATAGEFAQSTLEQIRGIVGFIQIFVGIIAIVFIIYSGFKVLISDGSGDDELSAAKTQLIYSVVGLAVVILSEVIVRGIIFPENGESLPDTERFAFVVKGIVNFMAGFIGFFSFVVLVYGGYSYVALSFDDGQGEKVKKIIIGALIGIVLSLGAFAFVNTILDFGNPDEIIEEIPVNPSI